MVDNLFEKGKSMRYVNVILLSLLMTFTLKAESFYVLTGIDRYDPIVVADGRDFQPYNDDIKSLMQANALELNVDTKNHPSTVLAFIISKFALGDTVGVRVALELGEYVKRSGSTSEVFVLSYRQQKIFEFSKEDLEDDLADTIEEMLETFSTQYKDDNKKLSEKKKAVTHETFAKDMSYENSYKVAKEKALKEGKEIMVFMTTSYCPWCRKLEERILSQEHIDEKIKATHVPVMLNYDEKKFPKSLNKISVTPALYVVDPETDVMKEGFVGYSSRSSFLNYLQQKEKKIVKDKALAYEDTYKVAEKKALNKEKDILVFMTTPNCSWCDKLETRVLSQKETDEMVRATHVPVKLNYYQKQFPKSLYKVDVAPALCVVDAKTHEVKETFLGYNSHKRFLSYLHKKNVK
jgi:thioredoxin-related protein